MNSGVIANNAYDGNGGVCVDIYSSGTFLLSGGEIVNNTATYGGVYVANGSFKMSGDAVIANNTVTSGHGGGVYAVASSFEMCGNAVIANNKTSMGGGVSVYAFCTFVMSGNAVIAGYC